MFDHAIEVVGALSWAGRVQAAQAISGLCWLAVVLLMAPAVCRVLRGQADMVSVFAALQAFVGLTQVGFVVRWYIWQQAMAHMEPAEVSFWLALYVASTVEALAFFVTGLAYKRLHAA